MKSTLPQPGVSSLSGMSPFGPPSPGAMPLPTDTSTASAAAPHIDRTLLVFRRIAAPLLSAVTGYRAPAAEGETAPPAEAGQIATTFMSLVESTVEISRAITERLRFGDNNQAAQWLTAGAAADAVAGFYRANGRPLGPSEIEPLLAALETALTQGMERLGFRRDTLDTDPTPPLGHVYKALAPVVTAVARFSFGRDQNELLLEITDRLMSIAGGVTARLNKSENPDVLYYSILDVAGEFYMECHFAEMDRLLEMPPEERKEYVRTHDKQIPMEPVWETLNLKLSMLEAVTRHLQEQSP